MDPAALAQEIETAALFERAVLDELTRTVGAEAAFFATVKSRPTATLLDETSLARAFGDPRLERDVVPLKQAALRARGVCVDTDVLGDAREHALYFRTFAAPLGGRHSLFAMMTVRGVFLGTLMLGRVGRHARSFGGAEIALVERLLPSLAIARASYDAVIPRRADLSRRERDVLDYLCLGYTNREIATACGTSPNTVRNQLVSLFAKLGASTRAEAVALARG
ncbi:MAG: LuxR C-terminal-related transcriptional regulator [Polyangiales bacterium]